jgi:hypothetical protein
MSSRREFIALSLGAVAIEPIAARAVPKQSAMLI